MPPKPDTGYNPVQSISPETQAPADYIRTQASPQDFGSQVGGALQQLDQVGQRFDSQATDVAVQWQDRHNAVATDQAFSQFQNKTLAVQYGDPANPNDHGYFGLQGQDALNGRVTAMSNLEAARQQTLSGMQNDAQKLAFDQASRRLMTNVSEQIGAHANQQWNVWAHSQQDALQDNALRGLGSAPSDDNAFETNLVQGMHAAAAKAALSGLSTEASNAAQLGFQNKAIGARAEALGATDPVSALAFVKSHESNMTGQTFATLVEHLTPKANAVTAQNLINGIIPLPGTTPLGPGAQAVQQQALAQGVDPIQAQTVAQLETRGGARPDRPGSQFSGIYQMSNAEFAANGGTTRGDPTQEAAAGVANLKRMQPLADAAAGGTAQPWQTYMLHQQGDAGGAALLRADPSQNVVDALAPAYKGDRQKATAAISANGGDPSASVEAFTSIWKQRYQTAEQGVRGAMLSSGPQPYPDMPALEQKVIDQTAGNPDLQHEALATLHQRMALVNVQAEQAKQDLSHTLSGTNAALLSGDTSVTIPETTIRAAYPAPEADRMVEDLNVSKSAGLLLKGLQWAPPGQINQTMADLGAPDSKVGLLLRSAATTTKAAPGAMPAVPDANALPPETPDQTLKRQAILGRATEILNARTTALQTDPASYVMSEPNVKAAYGAIDDKDPTTFAAYARASTSVQRSLGVPESDIHILPTSQAAGIVKGLMNADPTKMDAGAELDQMATKYGDAWPQVYGDLVKAKLPASFQTLGIMDQPSQAAARTELQNAQQQVEKLGGLEKYTATLPPNSAKTVDNALDGALSNFHATTVNNSGGQEAYANIRSSVQLLAYSYVARQGMDPTVAATKAAQAVVGDRYDFDGSMRAPKGTMDQVQSATASTLAALKPSDLAPFGGDSSITQDQRQSIELDAARRGSWVPNADDSGLILMGLRKNGLGVVRLANGNPVQVKFNDAARSVQPASNLPPAQIDNGTPASQQAGGG